MELFNNKPHLRGNDKYNFFPAPNKQAKGIKKFNYNFVFIKLVCCLKYE